MTETKTGGLMTYFRLQIAYFLQFAIWGSFGFALCGYAIQNWGGEGVGLLGAAVPLGAFIGPLVFAPIADRYFPAQRVLACLHLICGILLCVAGTQPTMQYLTVLMFLVGVFYMPTVALMNSVVFKHVPNSNNAPYVFVFGTTGWVVVVLFIQAFFGGGNTNEFFYVGAVCCFLLSVYSLTLPNTPPQTREASSDGKARVPFTALLRKPSFLVFALAILLAGIPACGFLFTMCVSMLSQRGFPAPLALTTINQFSELFFMTALPFCAARFGLKKVLLIGMAAWFLRYACWIDSAFSFAVIGLLLHGMCYSFLYNASYMYGEKIAPPEIRTSVQGFITFLLLGVGQVFGALLAGYVIHENPAPVASDETKITVTEELCDIKDNKIVACNYEDKEFAFNQLKFPAWNDKDQDESAWKYLDLKTTLLGEDKKVEKPAGSKPDGRHLGVDLDKDNNKKITYQEIQEFPEEGRVYNGLLFTRDNLTQLFKELYALNKTVKPEDVKLDEISISRQDYLKLQSTDWSKVFTIPLAMLGIAFFLFLFLGKDPEKNHTEVNTENAA
ncbi:MAG: MFS transporter [Planctomycetia bacterium]|nr:MFS transporter [Planctomycetia bacterium]